MAVVAKFPLHPWIIEFYACMAMTQANRVNMMNVMPSSIIQVPCFSMWHEHLVLKINLRERPNITLAHFGEGELARNAHIAYVVRGRVGWGIGL